MAAVRGLATIAQLGEFDTLIDARSPSEFAEDRLPAAINCPVLDDEQRARVGTLYKQVSPFDARKVGAVLVARNVATAIETRFADRPRDWRPLVYCWRGGQRSGAFSHILREVGWDAHRLVGGYKTWRRHVVEQLETLPARFQYHVISGATGSGKSRVLESLAAHGAQVLHLEALAAHKGSVLGHLPDRAQPSQKGFESALYSALAGFDPQRVVFVEAESRKIGRIHLPEALIGAIRQSPCVRIAAGIAARVEFLLRDYDYAVADPDWLRACLRQLHGLQSNETLQRWEAMIAAGDFAPLVRELLELHYDPLYQRSQDRNFVDYGSGGERRTDDLTPAGIDKLAEDILTSA